MKPDSAEIDIPPDAVQKWQEIVDLLADIVRVPSAVVCKLDPPHDAQYRILASSNSEKNPFPVDDIFAMNVGTFCETVIKSRKHCSSGMPWRTISGNGPPRSRWG